METPIFAVKDKLVGYGQPYTKYNEEVAKRDFTNAMMQQPIKNDLELYVIGSYESETAKITLLPEPHLVLKGESIDGNENI